MGLELVSALVSASVQVTSLLVEYLCCEPPKPPIGRYGESNFLWCFPKVRSVESAFLFLFKINCTITNLALKLY